jgi:EmrB/QacA subfamily drug resistance transporter
VATTPLYGKLGDMYGRKRIFLAGIVIFLVGSVLCGLAESMDQLIVFRAIQGLGAGGLVSIPLAAIGDLVPPRELGKWIGYSGFVFAFASVAGPLLGGVFAQHASWRWAFLVNVPVGVISFVVVWRRLQLPPRRTEHAIDYLGAALLTGAVGCVVLLTSWGGSREPWDSPVIIGLGVGALVLLALLVVRERRAPEPVLPPRLFRIPTARVTLAINALLGLLFFAGLYFVSAYLQFVDGVDPTESGITMIPFMGSTVAATILVGRLVDRSGRYRIYPIVGSAMAAGGLVLLADLDSASTSVEVMLRAAILGFGLGLAMQVLILAIQNAVDRRDVGIATATSMFARQLGGVVGLAVLGSVLNNRLAYWVPRLVPGSADIDLTTLRGRPETLGHLSEQVREGVVEAFARSLHSVFLWCIPLAVIAFLLALRLRNQPLREELHQGTGDDIAVALEGAVVDR